MSPSSPSTQWCPLLPKDDEEAPPPWCSVGAPLQLADSSVRHFGFVLPARSDRSNEGISVARSPTLGAVTVSMEEPFRGSESTFSAEGALCKQPPEAVTSTSPVQK